MVRLEVHLRICVATGLHTTGNRRRLGVDKAQALDERGRPIIPATSLKGFLRAQAEQLLRSWGHEVCVGQDPQSMCDVARPCLTCRVFGNPRLPATLRVEAAHLGHDVDGVLPVRSGVAISRHRRAAYPQRLFFFETAGPYPAEWRALCEGYFPDRNAALEAAALVALASRWGYAIGGGRTRGLGWVKRCDFRVLMDGQQVPDNDLVALWQRWERARHVAGD